MSAGKVSEQIYLQQRPTYSTINKRQLNIRPEDCQEATQCSCKACGVCRGDKCQCYFSTLCDKKSKEDKGDGDPNKEILDEIDDILDKLDTLKEELPEKERLAEGLQQLTKTQVGSDP